MNEKRKRGGQFGNQNARKHGFYSRALSKDRKRDFRKATKVVGLDEEIALLRVEIKSLMEQDPPNRRLIAQDIKILASLVGVRHNTGGDKHERLETAAKNYFERLPFLLGIRNSPENNQPQQNE